MNTNILKEVRKLRNKINGLDFGDINKEELDSLERELKDITEKVKFFTLQKDNSAESQEIYKKITGITNEFHNLRKYISYKERVALENKKINALNEFIDFFVKTFKHVDNLKFKVDGNLIKKQKELLLGRYNITTRGLSLNYPHYISLRCIQEYIDKGEKNNSKVALIYEQYNDIIDELKALEEKKKYVSNEIYNIKSKILCENV